MKKNLLLVFYFLFFVLLAKDGFCQNPFVKMWNRRYGGTSADTPYTIQQTRDGGYIIGGHSRSGISGNKTQVSQGDWDYWIVKTNSSGAKQWDKDFGGSFEDNLTALQQTADGGYILGGYSISPVSGDKTQPLWGDYDFWIVKTDSLGNKLWDKDFGGNHYDQLYSLQQTTDGGYILGGLSNSDISGDKTQAAWGYTDYWIIKIDSIGNKQWDKTFGGTSLDGLLTLRQTSDKGYILGGSSDSDSSGDKSQNIWGDSDYWIIKTDSTGNKQWDKDLGGTGSDNLLNLLQTSDQGYILGGGSYSGIGGDKTQINWGQDDYWIVKTDSSGNKQWDKDFGGTLSEYFAKIFLTGDGGYLVSGISYSDSSGDKSENCLGGGNAWLIKTDSSGNKQWDKTIFTLGGDTYGGAVETDSLCYTIVAGSAANIGGYKTMGNLGYGEYWMVKLCDSTLTTSISNIQSQTSNFTIFPNPANDFITISFTQEGEKKVSVEVYDLLGTSLPLTPKGELRLSKSGNLKINISDFIPGVYIVEIKMGNDYYRKKIIKM